jgi:hypothetical protein
MNEKIYLAFGQEQKGPFTRPQVEEKLVSGEAQPSTLAWIQGGRTEWIPLSDLLSPPPLPPTDSTTPARAGNAYRPYVPAASTPEQASERQSRKHPGIGRLIYFGSMFGASLVLNGLNAVLARLLGESTLALTLTSYSVGTALAVLITFHRLKNVGYNPWWSLLLLAPFSIVIVGIPCLLAPPGYAYNKRLDLPAKIIGGIMLTLLVLGFLGAILGSISPKT